MAIKTIYLTNIILSSIDKKIYILLSNNLRKRVFVEINNNTYIYYFKDIIIYTRGILLSNIKINKSTK